MPYASKITNIVSCIRTCTNKFLVDERVLSKMHMGLIPNK